MFQTVSLFSKDFRHLAYNRHMVSLALVFLTKIDIGRNGCLYWEALHKLLQVINLAPANFVKSLALRNVSKKFVSKVLFHSHKKLRKLLLLLLNLSGTRGQLAKNMVAFRQLRELNVCGTSIDNHFLSEVSRMCKHLFV